MDQVVDRVIALYMDNQRAYDDNPPSPGTTGKLCRDGWMLVDCNSHVKLVLVHAVGEEDGPGDAGRGYEDVNLAISFIDHGACSPCGGGGLLWTVGILLVFLFFFAYPHSLLGGTDWSPALQAAQQAVQAQVDEETVVAALLHDIGWLAPKPKDATKLTSADEKVGSRHVQTSTCKHL